MQNKKNEQKLQKKIYGYFIGIVNKKDIFLLQSIILKNKKKNYLYHINYNDI